MSYFLFFKKPKMVGVWYQAVTQVKQFGAGSVLYGITELRAATRVRPFLGRIACRGHPLAVELCAAANILGFEAHLHIFPSHSIPRLKIGSKIFMFQIFLACLKNVLR